MKRFHSCIQNVIRIFNVKISNISYNGILFFCCCFLFAGCYSYMSNHNEKEKAEYTSIIKRYKYKDKKAKAKLVELTERERHDFLKLIKKFRNKYVEAPAPQMTMDGIGEVNITSYGSVGILFDDYFRSIHVPGKTADKETRHKLYELMDKIDNRLFEFKK